MNPGNVNQASLCIVTQNLIGEAVDAQKSNQITENKSSLYSAEQKYSILYSYLVAPKTQIQTRRKLL